jgi:acyl-CoA thioester hydrolase
MEEGSGPVVFSRIAVRYAETDKQGVVYHANYIIYFEVGRTDFCANAGYPYPRMEEDGVFIVVTEVRARYRRAATYGDELTVETRFGDFRSRGCSFYYRILLPDGGVSAEGETHHLFLDAAGKPRTVPQAVRKAFETFVRG